MLAAVFAFLPAFYAGSQDGSGFAEGSFVFFCGYAAFVLGTYVYTHYILHTYVHNVRELLIFGFLKGDQIKGMLMQILVPSIVGWGIALIIS
jgi:hypothetical protein